MRQLAAALAAGSSSVESLVETCLGRIAETEPTLHAWVHLERDAALAGARALDALRLTGRPVGMLHGIPAAIGASLDVADVVAPDAEGMPGRDATMVAKLREAGGLPLGQTAAGRHGGGVARAVSNPREPSRRAGSGAAAAVAAGHVPLGAECAWSDDLIRSASYCGVFGLIPGRGCISRHRARGLTPTLDRIGVFATSLADAADLVDAVCGFDAADDSTYARPKPRFAEGVSACVPVEPSFVVLGDVPADDDAAAAFAQLLEVLGGRVETVAVPESFAHFSDHRDTVRAYELREALAGSRSVAPESLDEARRGPAAQVDVIEPDEYAESLAVIDSASAYFTEVFNEFDAVLAPAAPGAAPLTDSIGGERPHTAAAELCGLPMLSLPLLSDAQGLPVGLALTAGREEDARLCRTASWLQQTLAAL